MCISLENKAVKPTNGIGLIWKTEIRFLNTKFPRAPIFPRKGYNVVGGKARKVTLSWLEYACWMFPSKFTIWKHKHQILNITGDRQLKIINIKFYRFHEVYLVPCIFPAPDEWKWLWYKHCEKFQSIWSLKKEAESQKGFLPGFEYNHHVN